MRVTVALGWSMLSLLLFPVTAFTELPNADDRPFWTQKTCYRMDNTVYAVGLSTGRRTLEDARKESFRSALWEISNYAQIQDTTLLLVETQMTYEEQNPDNSYSVWRLVKTPLDLIRKTKTLLEQNSLNTQKQVTKIQKYERENREDLADELRRALLQGDDVGQTSGKSPAVDKTLPTGWIKSMKSTYRSDEIIDLSIRAKDDKALKRLVFSIKGSKVRKSWDLSGRKLAKRLSFPASVLSPGKQVYAITITDAAGNMAMKQGAFRIINLHDELHDILSSD